MTTANDLDARIRTAAAVLDEDLPDLPPDLIRDITGDVTAQPPLVPSAAAAGRRSRRSHRTRWVVGLGVPTAAAIAIAAVVITSPGTTGTAAAATAPMLNYHPAGAPAIQPVLSRLAKKASTQPALHVSPGEYLYQETENWYIAIAVSDHVGTASVTPSLEEVWSIPGGTTKGNINIKRDLTRSAAPVAAGTLTAAEERAARKAVAYGDPTKNPTSPPGAIVSTASLPLRPRALFQTLADLGDEKSPSLNNRTHVAYAMGNLANRLIFTPPSPKVLSTVYRMLALFPGVSDAGRVTDRAGRHGIAIAVPVGGDSYRLIADPQTGRILDIEDIQVKPNGVKLQTPFVVSYQLFLRSAVTQSLHRP